MSPISGPGYIRLDASSAGSNIISGREATPAVTAPPWVTHCSPSRHPRVLGCRPGLNAAKHSGRSRLPSRLSSLAWRRLSPPLFPPPVCAPRLASVPRWLPWLMLSTPPVFPSSYHLKQIRQLSGLTQSVALPIIWRELSLCPFYHAWVFRAACFWNALASTQGFHKQTALDAVMLALHRHVRKLGAWFASLLVSSGL